jgi:hypothetical protein
VDEAVKLEIDNRTEPRWYGLASPSGWDDLVSELFLKLVDMYPDLKIYQIKEKFGGLRFYCNVPFGSDGSDLIFLYEEQSFNVCQSCGSTQNVTTNESGWITTLCSECREYNQCAGELSSDFEFKNGYNRYWK